MAWCIIARQGGKQKAAQGRPYLIEIPDFLPNQGIGRARHRDRFTCLNDVRSLGVVRVAAGGDSDACHRDAGHQGQNDDLEVGATVRRVE